MTTILVCDTAQFKLSVWAISCDKHTLHMITRKLRLFEASKQPSPYVHPFCFCLSYSSSLLRSVQHRNYGRVVKKSDS